MVTIKFYEDIIFYHYMILDAGTTRDVLHTKVVINDKTYNYYQTQSTIIITERDLGGMYDKSDIIPLKNHLAFIHTAKQEGLNFYVKINNIVYNDTEYEFVDITRNLKLKQIKNKLLLKSVL